jgi:hypothetical protein
MGSAAGTRRRLLPRRQHLMLLLSVQPQAPDTSPMDSSAPRSEAGTEGQPRYIAVSAQRWRATTVGPSGGVVARHRNRGVLSARVVAPELTDPELGARTAPVDGAGWQALPLGCAAAWRSGAVRAAAAGEDGSNARPLRGDRAGRRVRRAAALHQARQGDPRGPERLHQAGAAPRCPDHALRQHRWIRHPDRHLRGTHAPTLLGIKQRLPSEILPFVLAPPLVW